MPSDPNPYASPNPYFAAQRAASGDDLQSPIRLSGAVTLREFWQAMRLARMRGWWSALRPVSLALLAVWVLWLAIAFLKPGAQMNDAATPFLLGVVAGLMLASLLRWTIQRRQVRQMHQLRYGTFLPFSREVTAEGIVTLTDYEEHRVRWGGYRACRIAGPLAVVYLRSNPMVFQILPRRLLENDGDWDRLLLALAARLPQL